MKNWAKSQIKYMVDRFFPRAGLAVRLIRAQSKAKANPLPHPEFGFMFAGNDEMMRGEFEKEEVEIFRSLLPKLDCVIDVGANIGYYVCIARALGKPCVAFEPLQTNLSMLYLNLAKNGWLDTEIWPVGVADHVGMEMMYGSDTGASLVRGWARQSNPIGTAIVINTLNNIIGGRFVAHRLLLLVDVEGFEYNVLRGATRLFESPTKPVVLMEIALALHHPDANPNYLATFEFFWDRGYRMVSADASARQVSKADVVSWVKDGRCGWDVHNWLALPDDWN